MSKAYHFYSQTSHRIYECQTAIGVKKLRERKRKAKKMKKKKKKTKKNKKKKVGARMYR